MMKALYLYSPSRLLVRPNYPNGLFDNRLPVLFSSVSQAEGHANQRRSFRYVPQWQEGHFAVWENLQPSRQAGGRSADQRGKTCVEPGR